jgi:uncharacterized protein (TIGR00290 family)
MLKRQSALLSWSGGKDSALCLYELMCNKKYFDLEIKALITTLTKEYDRISMHGVRRELLIAQSRSLGIPVEEVWIPNKASNETYEAQMIKSIAKWKDEKGVKIAAFGDLFLEDIQAYRERFLGIIGVGAIFPIWGRNTKKLSKSFIESGFKAIICTVDPKKLDRIFCGREYDERLLSEIPESVDPCGENGEFHTFVYDGPIFKKKIDVKIGEVVERDGFCFADIHHVGFQSPMTCCM